MRDLNLNTWSQYIHAEALKIEENPQLGKNDFTCKFRLHQMRWELHPQLQAIKTLFQRVNIAVNPVSVLRPYRDILRKGAK